MKKISKIVVIALMVALVLTACGPKEPANELEAVKEAGKIVFGTSADFPPFESVDENGNFVGFDVDLMKELGKRMGLEVEIVDMPFDSLIAAVQEGKINASVAAFNYSEERDQAVDFTDPYYFAEDGILVAEDFADEITGPEVMANYIVGIQTGSMQEAWVVENLVDTGLLPEDNLFRYERIDQAAMDIKAGRVDMLMTEAVVTKSIAKELGGLKVPFTGVVSNGPVNIIVPEGAKELTAEMNKYIAEMLADGFIDSIILKHMQ